MPPVWMSAPQGSAQWLRERLGCLTASRMSDAMDWKKAAAKMSNTEVKAEGAKRRQLKTEVKAEGAKRRQLKIDLVAERLTDTMVERYVNDAMRWGIEQEGYARDRYEEVTGSLVMPCGFALHGTIPFFGASPDGLVGDDGLIEIKCPSTSTFIAWTIDGVVPEQHKPQMLAQLAVTGRRFVDFFAYDPRIKNADRQYFLKRFEPSPEDIAKVEEEARQFLAEVDALFDAITRGPESQSAPSPDGAAGPTFTDKETVNA